MSLKSFARVGSICATILITLILNVEASKFQHIRQEARNPRYRRQYGPLPNVTLGLESNEPESGPWGPWTEASQCSRTCGGGVAFQTRICLDTRVDGSHSCVGPSKRFYSCNVQDCPPEEPDFREKQCSRFDRIPFEERYYQWVPYTKAQNPCELNCMPRGERFYYRQARKVIDGTRCYDDGSLDICVDGTCMPVGCDKMLGSSMKEDKCRVCGGDGTSCRTVSGVFDSNDLRIGYNDIILIPAGAINIRVQEIHPTNNYLAVRKANGDFYLNGNWRIDMTRELKFAGTLFHYERRSHGHTAPESLQALGPTVEPIFVSLLFQEKNLGVSYEYSLPANVRVESPSTDSYSWMFGDYGPCSRTCGGGIQLRAVYCARTSNREPMPEYLCDVRSKPGNNRTCGHGPCPPGWYVSEWSPCRCPGVQHRDVICQKTADNGRDILVAHPDECKKSGDKPEVMALCRVKGCPPFPTSEDGPKKECDSASADPNAKSDGKKKDDADKSPDGTPSDADITDSTLRPDDANTTRSPVMEVCNMVSRVQWNTTKWSKCDSNCGKGKQTRSVTCVDTEDNIVVADSLCDSLMRPNESQECDEIPCSGVDWVVSEWSSCDKLCGSSIRTRRVRCATENGEIYPDTLCQKYRKPNTTEPCVNHKGCDAMWFTSTWSSCSTTCGNGTRTRFVFCGMWDDDQIITVPGKCNITQMPETNETCVNEPCGSTWFTGPWDMCSGPCSSQREQRRALCLTENGGTNSCTASQEPSTEKPCKVNGTCDELDDGMLPMDACSNSTFGCCPDGSTPRKENYENCPPVEALDGCEKTKFGCCRDGETAAFGPFQKGCAINCTQTKFGCCQDGETPANGTDFQGCVVQPECMSSKHGCCPDGETPAEGPNQEGCELLKVELCENTKHGCCKDGQTAAKGPNQEGCDELAKIEGSGDDCIDEGSGDGQGGKCGSTDAPVTVSVDCLNTTFGCCPDGLTTAEGENFAGCPEDQNCNMTVYGCCPDNMTSATGPNLQGCPTNTTDISSISTLFTDDTVTDSNTTDQPIKECASSEHGCCPDNMSPAEGPGGYGCPCDQFQFGCCPDGKSPARGERYYGCTCHQYPHGCCQDKYTPARGPGFDGCLCERMLYGCCSDGVTPSTGPNREGCICDNTTYGCCPDRRTAARGPNYAGCPCTAMPYGCCQDNYTPARGHNFDGCLCDRMLHGCCPDRTTPATGPNMEGCNCQNTTYGCCPDRRTPARGPNYAGCSCDLTTYGCCPDRRTPARGPNYEGCSCETLPHGCCPDGRTPARGPGYEGCECINTVYGCCSDGVTTAAGPRQEGCPSTTDVDDRILAQACSLPKERGSCQNYTVKWYFDEKYGGCARFWYGGCEGNGNKFNTQEDCERICVKPRGNAVCVLPKVRGSCDDNQLMWYFDKEQKRCHQFYYGGCLGNKNKFSTREECEQLCVGLDPIDYPRQPSTPEPPPLPVPSPCQGYGCQTAAQILPGPQQVIAPLNTDSYLQCNAIGFPEPTVTWWKGQTMLPSNSIRYNQYINFTLLIRRVNEADGGVYTCQAYNGLGPTALWDVTLFIDFDHPESRTTQPLVPVPSRGPPYDPYDPYINRTTVAPTRPSTRPSPTPRPQEPVTVEIHIASEEYKVGTSLQVDCVARGYPPPQVRWYKGSVPLEPSEHLSILPNNTLVLAKLTSDDSGEYVCQASNSYSESSATVPIKIDNIFVPVDCKDSPFFANCPLVVRVQYCNNQHYAKFCCRSCLLAGQLDRNKMREIIR